MSEEVKVEETPKKKENKVVTLDFGDQLPWLLDRIIYLAKNGSQAYGTTVPESDEDYKGVVIPTLPYFFGTGEFHFEQAVKSKPDLVFFGIQKFFRLAAKAAPQALEMLFTAPEDVLICHPLMQKIIENRDVFLSQQVAKSMVSSPLKALAGILTFVRERERLIQYLDDKTALPEEEIDYKGVMHCVRIVRMGLEILDSKGVIVKRPDAEELLNIRAGGWNAEKLYLFGLEAEKALEDVMKRTKLPAKPDVIRVDALCTAIVQASFEHEIKLPVMATGFQHMTMTFGVGVLNAKKLTIKEQEEA